MRLARLVIIALAILLCQLPIMASAGDKPAGPSAPEATRDIAEQLVPQVLGWFAELGKSGRVPVVFTGITREPRQLIVELDAVGPEPEARRRFVIWLARKLDLAAYAFAAPVVREAPAPGVVPGETVEERLEIFASSRGRDALGVYRLVREDGRIAYEQVSITSTDPKSPPDLPFHGLLRAPGEISTDESTAFDAAWTSLQSKITWRQVGGGDEANAILSSALRAYQSGDCKTALDLLRKAEDVLRQTGRAEGSQMGVAGNLQGLCHRRLLNAVEAERHYRRAIDLFEKTGSAYAMSLAVTLDNLASLYIDQGRFDEAEPLRLRAMAVFRAGGDEARPRVATGLQNLAVLYQKQGRTREALAAYEEALALAADAYGAESQTVAVIADNLAGIYLQAGDLAKAAPLYDRALTILRKVMGEDHPDTALALQNRALLLSETGKIAAAEQDLLAAIRINERLYGDTHDSIAAALSSLVLLRMEQGRWSDALAPARRAAGIAAAIAARGRTKPPSEDGQGVSAFRRLAQVAYAVGASDPALMDEAFLAAQRALATDAAQALSQLAARHAVGDGGLARLLRERQDLAVELESRERGLITAVAQPPGNRDRAAEEKLRVRVAAIGERMTAIDRAVAAGFPAFEELSRGTPVSIREVQTLLRPGEVLLQYLDVPAIGSIPDAAYVWAVTTKSARWIKLDHGAAAIARHVAKLRCGLDAKRWHAETGPSCGQLLPADTRRGRWLPFDLAAAHALWKILLGPLEAETAGKDLLVVPSGALTTLPFSVLLTKEAATAFPDALEGYRKAAWLGTRQPITVLPSAGALQSLRKFARQSTARRAYLGVGNPLLDGTGDATDAESPAALARASQRCAKPATRRDPARPTAPVVASARMLSGGLADVSTIRRLPPLPETADELCGVGQRFAAPEDDILLGGRATEAGLKALSETGRLADYRILHFATHGALSGELKGSAEPGLILTPPAPSADSTALERDDGYLSASEIAALKLDADWIVLSACNTAGAGSGKTDALSGMARAFFYAGARSLLVSHWEVGSDAAVKLVTRAFQEMKARPSAGRAETMRVAMRLLLERGTASEAHPRQWAPFVVVGEGGAFQGGAPSASRKPLRRAKPAASWTEDFWR